jgi:hypothetical protein
MSKIYFITFGGGSIEYLEAVTRIMEQAKKIFIHLKKIDMINQYLVY